MLQEVIVTTTVKAAAERAERARAAAAELGCAYVERRKLALPLLQEQHQAENILVVQNEGFVLHTSGGEFFFHPSMAELRLLQVARGNGDHMADALGLQPGMRVLDCTLGLGSDALVASRIVGPTGYVCGLEISKLTSFISAHGLRDFLAMRADSAPIDVQNADYEDYLKQLPDDSFDVVFFDPMFRQPIRSSSQLKPLRVLADHRPLSAAALAEACRVAKRRVVVKEVRGSAEFERLGIRTICGGRYSRVQFGVIETETDGADE